MVKVASSPPDRRFISSADQLIISAGGTGNLAIFDVKAAHTTIVNKFSNLKPWAEGSTGDSMWAPDGKQIAYAGWRKTPLHQFVRFLWTAVIETVARR
jgi:hypothetical protein